MLGRRNPPDSTYDFLSDPTGLPSEFKGWLRNWLLNQPATTTGTATALPTGNAGGDLAGSTYPSPFLKASGVTAATYGDSTHVAQVAVNAKGLVTGASNVALSASGYATVQDEGTPLTQRSTMNFVGSGVTAADSGSLTTVTIPGGGASSITLGTSLPGSPSNGDMFILSDSTSTPTYMWLLRYNSSASSNKWECIGGTPKVVTNATASTTTSATYVDPTNNVSFTLPNAGDYQIQMIATGWVKASNATGVVSIKVGSATTLDANGVLFYNSAGQVQVTLGTTFFATGASASDIVKLQFKVEAGATFQLDAPKIFITPTRIT